jgi:O-antigen biosynthesis protein
MKDVKLNMLSNQTLLIIGKVWPEPASSAAGTRMMQLIHLFRDAGMDITFVSASGDSEFATDLESFGVKKVSIKLNHSSFDQFIQKLNPDWVMFDRFMTEEQFGWRVAGQCPEAVRILNTEDLHCLRAARQKAWRAGGEFHPEKLLSEETAKREIASIYRCDLSLIISEEEIKMLKNQFRIDDALLQYLPFMSEPVHQSEIEALPGYEERSGFISLGNFLHEPNRNAVLWLKEEIWPLIRKQFPDAELHIFGAYPSHKVYQLHQPEDGFMVKGRAEDAKSVLSKAKVLLAPLRFGAGLKGKLVEAMQCGTPSVTTSIGAEGIAGGLEWNGIIENDPVRFAASAVSLYRDQALWETSQRNGFELIGRRFNKHSFCNEFMNRLTEIRKTLQKQREHNFTGAMLMYHTTRSTKYLAKWIEEKNRRG